MSRVFPCAVVAALFACCVSVAAVPAAPHLDERLRQLESGRAAGLAAADVLAALYAERGRTLLWDDARRATLLRVLGSADLEGLNPNDYGVEALAHAPPLTSLTEDERIDADFAATDALLRYVYHLRFGKVDAASHDANWNFPRQVRGGNSIESLAKLIAAADLAQAVGDYAPKSALYRGLKSELARYRQIAADGGWPRVDATPPLKAAATGPAVVELRRRLAREGFDVADLESDHYDAPLEGAVRSFQKQNGLDADGVIGARTLAALNTTVEQRVQQIRVNLERLRWVEGARTARFLAVNVAGFEVHLIDGEESVWSARAQVGKPYRQTPVFTANMTYVVLNPDWTVPPTILRNDVLPELAKNPGYLDTKHMEVLDGQRRRVDPSTIDWRRYRSGGFPYSIRQVPGPWNSLGRVKFIFPNSHFVFLHDTPSQSLFERSERTFSSGCIRVEHPFELLRLLLPDWDQSRIDQTLATGAETKVTLPQPLPVMVLYLTALALQDGTVRFYRDVYDRDGWVSAALAAGFVYVPPAGMPGSR